MNAYKKCQNNKSPIPVTAVIPTRDRVRALEATLSALMCQQEIPSDVIVVDSSTNSGTLGLIAALSKVWPSCSRIIHVKANVPGAAPQRNQGVALALTPYVLLLDDDILLEPTALMVMWQAIQYTPNVVGVTPTYVGDGYAPPRRLGRWMMAFLNSGQLESYAGRVIGPGFTLVPADDSFLPEFVDIDWMGSGCALYPVELLPKPPFPERFQDASLFEDLCLSLTVSSSGKLVNARLARAIHADEGGEHKKGRLRLAKMELVNRYYIMRCVLKQGSVADHFRFLVMIGYMTTGAFKSPRKWLQLPAHLLGLLAGAISICWNFGSFRSDENDR